MSAREYSPFFIDQEEIILKSNGIWLADGIEISHNPTRRLFAKSIQRDEKSYFLCIGRETKRIQVEDTAYFVQRIDGTLSQGFDLLLNDETREKLNPSTLRYQPGRLVCSIKQSTEEARFLHAPYFDLLKDLEEDSSGYYLNFYLGETTPLRIKISSK